MIRRPLPDLRPAMLLAALLLVALPARSEAQSDASVIYVVRHAERAEDGTSDPPISAEGEARARLIASIFADVDLTDVHTTDFKRTRSTLAPTAEAKGLTPRIYDPNDLVALAERLRATPGRHLVVGHSNTNPVLVEELGGEPGGPIGEMEYDRGYVVVVRPGGATGSAVFRFGVAHPR